MRSKAQRGVEDFQFATLFSVMHFWSFGLFYCFKKNPWRYAINNVNTQHDILGVLFPTSFCAEVCQKLCCETENMMTFGSISKTHQ